MKHPMRARGTPRVGAHAPSCLVFAIVLGAAALGAAALAGCGSGGGGPASGNHNDAGGTPGSGQLTWSYDGANHAAGFATASLVRGGTQDFLQIAGGEATGAGIAFGVVSPSPLMPGHYTCAQSGTGRIIVSFVYTSPGVGPVTQACTIDITTVGTTGAAHAVGMFSATVPLDAGGTRDITNGSFDLPVVTADGGAF